VLSCDATAHAAQRVVDARQVRLVGGGGTDLRVGLAAALELRPAPDLVVVLTDGFTPWPAARPRVPVVVGLMDPAGAVPEWATAVPIGGPG
jgi:predicted metal-dependent peptidase